VVAARERGDNIELMAKRAGGALATVGLAKMAASSTKNVNWRYYGVGMRHWARRLVRDSSRVSRQRASHLARMSAINVHRRAARAYLPAAANRFVLLVLRQAGVKWREEGGGKR